VCPATQLPRLMLVTDRRRVRGRGLVDQIDEAVAGGVGIVQIREKDLPDDKLRDLVVRVRGVIPASIPIVVNGRERVARTQGVGLHLPSAAPAPRASMDPGQRPFFPYGRSVHGADETTGILGERPDYVILGHIYASESKPGLPGRGLALVESIRGLVGEVPIYAIGGVTVTRIPELIRAGASGVAVCGAILSSNDPRRVAQAMSLALNVAR
jgi:thiamine-phosphate diphosphorylase